MLLNIANIMDFLFIMKCLGIFYIGAKEYLNAQFTLTL